MDTDNAKLVIGGTKVSVVSAGYKYYRMGRRNRIMTIHPAYHVYPVIFIFQQE